MTNKFEYYENLSDADVIIQAGDHCNFKTFSAHSELLKDKSPYFRVALSSTWAKKEDGKIILKKPNVSPTVFRIILEYFYTGNLPLDQHDGLTILDLLIASDELLIVHDLLGLIQDHLINVKTEWLKVNFSTVLHVVFEREACKDLQDYCMDKICWNPKIIFDDAQVLKFEEYVLVSLLKHDNLQIEEIELWDYLIKWGIAQLGKQREYLEEDEDEPPSPPLNDINDLSKWDERDLQDLGEILKDCIPLIRFSEFSRGEFYDKIWPLKDILPLELKQDISLFHKNLEILPKSLLSPRKPIISINSNIIKPQQASKIPDWINDQDHVQLNSRFNTDRVRYEFKLLLRGSRDGFTPKIFHEKCDHKGPNVVVLKIRGSGQIIGGYNPLGWRSLKTRRWQYTKDSFLFSFGKHGNPEDAILSRITPSYEAIYDDPSFGPCFGKTDLDMRRQFNEENCSAKQQCYKQSIADTSKFAVDDYEVFQVLRHTSGFLTNPQSQVPLAELPKTEQLSCIFFQPIIIIFILSLAYYAFI